MPVSRRTLDEEDNKFGHWLSGFADGEACFYLNQRQREDRVNVSHTVQFSITLRDDDVMILQDVRKWFGCGYVDQVKRVLTGKARPSAVYRVNRVSDLVEVIIPHFNIYQLRSKKARDFAIWKQAVELIWVVNSRLSSRRSARFRKESTWEPREIAEFGRLVDLLKTTREYSGAQIQTYTTTRTI